MHITLNCMHVQDKMGHTATHNIDILPHTTLIYGTYMGHMGISKKNNY